MKIAFTPDPLNGWHRVHHVRMMGLFEVVPVSEADIVFNWSTRSVYCPPVDGAVNGRLTDVSKTMVEYVFNCVYGYSSTVTDGMAVEKPVAEQGKKNARIVNLSLMQMQPGMIYQRVLCDINSPVTKEDRYVVMRGVPVLLTRKTKHITPSNITGTTIDVEVMKPKEDSRINEFCRQIGLDFGELDILTWKDKDYIIDVNNIAGDALFFGNNGNFVRDCYIELFKKHYL